MAKPKVELPLRLKFPKEEKVDLKVAHIKELDFYKNAVNELAGHMSPISL